MMSLMMKMMYPCSKIREFVFDYSEGTLDPLMALRFRLHIAKCRDCNEYVRIYRMTADIRTFRKQSPPPQEFVDQAKDFLEKNGIADFSVEPDGKRPPQD